MMTSTTPSFDLRQEPWITVRRLSGEVDELSIVDVVGQAHQLRDIVGEVPTQTFAITRLLLAILHRSLPVAEDPFAVWADLWGRPTLPVDAVTDYLEEYAERFDLLHPRMPFYQVASLRTAKDEVFGLERLLADVPNGDPFFTTRANEGIARMSYAEAARWIIHCQAYDVSGIKSGSTDDARVKGGKGYPIGTGWAGGLGGILLEGTDLRQTLLLNLVLGSGNNHASPLKDGDVPVWERQPLTGAVEAEPGRHPTGQVDLFTWPSRRLRLAVDDGAITGVLICNGDRLAQQNQFDEPMTAWRRSETQEKKLGQSLVYMPRAHAPARALWRGLAALLPQGSGSPGGSGPEPSRPPGVIKWVRDLQSEQVLPSDYRLRTHAIGMAYGSQSSTVIGIIDDSLALHAVLLADHGRHLTEIVLDTVSRTDQAVTALAYLAANLVTAAGGEPEGSRDAARERAYFALDTPFRRWLAGLAPDADGLARQSEWFDTARRLLLAEARERIASVGDVAWVGRLNRMGRHVSTPEADAWFRAALRKALPEADPEPSVSHPQTSGAIA